MKSIGLVLVLTVAVPAFAAETVAPPADLTTIDVGTERLTLWPFTAENFLPGEDMKSDPVNLLFLNPIPGRYARSS